MEPEMKRLFALLKTDQPITSAQLAAAMHLSEKTVRSRLKLLAEVLDEHGAQLIAKPGIGYQLRITNDDALHRWLKETPQTHIPSTFAQRVDFLLGYLLYHPDYVKLEELSQALQKGRVPAVKEQIQKALEAGVDPQEILQEGLLAGMGVIGE